MNIPNAIHWLINNRYKMIAAWLSLLMLASVIIITRLFTADAIIDNSVGVWFNSKDPEIKLYEDYNASFGEKEWTLLLLKTQSIYDAKFLKQVDQATEEIEALDNIVKVTSITNARDNWSNNDDLDYRELYSEELRESGSADLIKTFKQQLASNPIFDKNIININDERFTTILIQNVNHLHDPSRYRIELVNGITQIIEKFNTIEDWGLAGTTVVNAELNKAAQRDVIVFYLLVSSLLTLICWFIFKTIRDLLIVLSVVVSSVLMAMASLALFNIPYNMATVMLPPLLIALPVAGVLHIITDFHHSHVTHSAQDALADIFSKLYIPTFWAAATTIAGLLSFGLSDIPPFYQLGLVGAFGVFISLVINISIAPILLFIFWNKKKKETKESTFFSISPKTQKILKNPPFIGVVTIALVVLLVGIKNAEVDTDYSRFFDKNTPVSLAYDLLDEAEMGQNPIIIHLKYPADKGFVEPTYFNATLDFESALKALPEVVKVLSVSDLIHQLDRSFNGSNKAKDHLKTYSRQQLSQLLLLGEISGNDDIDDLALKSKDEMQLVVITPYLSSNALHDFRENIAIIKAKHLPKEVALSITGTTVLWANMDTEITQTQVYTLGFIGLFLVILLPILFRSFWLGAMGFIINLLPLAITIGLMSWLGVKINMATVIIGAISVGVVVDDTIHMFYRIQDYRRKGESWAFSIEGSLETIGTSIFRTTIILIVAFTSMASSNFLPTAHFGIFVSISVAIALFLDLIIAPLVLNYFGKKADAKA